MTTASQVISKALSQVGYEEYPPNSNLTKYGVWYGWNGVPWCAEFLSWCFASAGGINLIGGKSASVAVIASRMRAMGRFSATPYVGSLAVFNDYTHIELIKSINANGTLSTVGGNTSNHFSGSISNGGGVFNNIRSRSLIRGYGNPAYASSVYAPVRPIPSTLSDLVVDGDFGPATIKRVQRWVGVSQDGSFGTLTKKALQRKLGVVADGDFGPTSTKALQRTVGTNQDGVWGSGTTRALQIYLNRIF